MRLCSKPNSTPVFSQQLRLILHSQSIACICFGHIVSSSHPCSSSIIYFVLMLRFRSTQASDATNNININSISTSKSIFWFIPVHYLLELGEDLLVVGGHGRVGDEQDHQVALLDSLVPGSNVYVQFNSIQINSIQINTNDTRDQVFAVPCIVLTCSVPTSTAKTVLKSRRGRH